MASSGLSSIRALPNGRSFLDFFGFLVPRALWPEKPHPIACRINALAGGPGAGTPACIVSEFYLNAGSAGILVGMMLVGMLLRLAYAYVGADRSNPGVVLLCAPLVATLPNLLTRSLAPRLFTLTLFVAPAILALWFVTRPVGRPLRTVSE